MNVYDCNLAILYVRNMRLCFMKIYIRKIEKKSFKYVFKDS